MTRTSRLRGVVLAGAVASVAALAGASAQQPGVKRTVLQQADISVTGREAVTAVAEIPPGSSTGRHTHPGEEIGYVLEGSLTVEQEGMAAATLGPGKTFLIKAGAVHNATNNGSTTARVLATYIVEKGKPLATPVAAK